MILSSPIMKNTFSVKSGFDQENTNQLEVESTQNAQNTEDLTTVRED